MLLRHQETHVRGYTVRCQSNRARNLSLATRSNGSRANRTVSAAFPIRSNAKRPMLALSSASNIVLCCICAEPAWHFCSVHMGM